MFWKFGFAATSSIDAILDKSDVSLEEILDEDDLLQECKSQNPKLISFLQQPRVLKRLLEHVSGRADLGHGQGPEWEEKVRFKYPYIASEVLACDIWAIAEGLLADPKELLEPFWAAVLSWEPDPLSAPTPHHAHPLFASSFRLPSHLENVPSSSDSLSAESSRRPQLSRQVSSSAAENGPGQGVLAGYWAKVNGFLLDKKPLEMLEFIKTLPMIVERFTAHVETPAVIDLLYRIIQCEESTPSAGIVDWLADRDLALMLVDLLSPAHSSDIHNNTSELLKAIIALSAPSPATLNQSADPTAPGYEGANGAAAGVVNNRIVRELAGEEVVKTMVAFMLDTADPKDPSIEMDHSVEARQRQVSEEEAPRPLNPRDSPASEIKQLVGSDRISNRNGQTSTSDSNRPRAPRIPVTPESRASSLVTCIGIFIELIRKNNSDYFEQHLFHTLRSHLLKRQQEISEQRLQKLALASEGGQKTLLEDDKEPADADSAQPSSSSDAIKDEDRDEEEDEMEGMEEAMAEISEKLGIVHLGPMLRVLCEGLSDFQKLLDEPKASAPSLQTTLGTIAPLGFERYRITELYAELLHCSNMALLNRGQDSGPQYSKKGTLLGGIDGLQVLARALQGQDETETAEGQQEDEQAGDISAADATLGGESNTDDNHADDANGSEGSPEVIRSRVRHTREQSKVGTSDSEMSIDESGDVSSEATPMTMTSDAGSAAGTSSTSVETPGDVQADIAQTPGLDASSTSESKRENQKVTTNGSSANVFADEVLYDGDLLKKGFLDSHVVPSILKLFFDYPWNNFLHNVVYDILQQFFNGRMNAGLNRHLTISVFTEGNLFQRIIDGHEANQKSAEGPRRIRLGYMGHLNLIAEETVKLLNRYPEEIGKAVEHCLPREQWDNLLAELQMARQKEAGPLAGGRPQVAGGIGLSMNGDTQSGAEDNTFASYLSSQIGNSSDDDDSDEENSWIATRMAQATSDDAPGFDDSFQPAARTGAEDDFDDDWGPFAGSSSDPAQPEASESSNPFGQNLTSADWAAEFHREAAASSAIEEHGFSGGESFSPSQTAADDPFVDLYEADFRKKDFTVKLGGGAQTAGPARRRSSASSAGSDLTAAQAGNEDAPLGPGVDSSTTEPSEDGRLVRKIDDGVGGQKEIAVPLDDVALAISASEDPAASNPTHDARDVDSAE